MKSSLIRIAKIVMIVEVLYLVLVNTALNLTMTQSVVNGFKPDKFNVSWERAWSLYPFRVQARGVAANGQSRSQQWQLQAPTVSASMSLLPLLWRSVSLNHVEVVDVAYRQRPRPRADRDYSDVRAYFPPIDGRELETGPANNSLPTTDKKPWDIRLGNVLARGRHDVWLYQIQGTLEGLVRADVTFQTRGGPFSLSNGDVDVELQSLVLNGDREVAREGRISGKVEFLPFVPKENKGSKVLGFLNLDAEVRTESESLAFLNIYLSDLQGMKVDGAGLLEGRMRLERGILQVGSDIKVSARELSLDLFDNRFEGDGSISIKASESEGKRDVVIRFASLEAFDNVRNALLFRGEGLVVEAQGNRSITPADDKRFKASRLAVTIPTVQVPDLSAYQAYMPDKWSLKLHGGKGNLQGSVVLTPTGFNVNLQLRSDAADVGIDEYRFSSNLDAALELDSPSITSGVDISGTHLHLHGARLTDAVQQSMEPWQAGVDVVKGRVKLLLPGDVTDDITFRELYERLKGTEIVPKLHSGDEAIKITGQISDLSWLSVLMENRFNLAISGSGNVTTELVLSRGWPAPGTKLEVHRGALGVDVLDYVAEGEGEVTFLLKGNGQNSDMNLDIVLDDAMMRRKGEKEAAIENVAIRLQALIEKVTFDGDRRNNDLRLHLQIPTAMVRDMSVYNHYLPENSPLQFTGGKAELFTDIKLSPDTADGYVKLKTDGLSARVDDQDVAGRLTALITLVGGVPEELDFDISGSSITLDNVSIVGKETTHDDEDWSARFELKKSRALWKKPVKLQIEADLQMTNSKPVVAIIANQRGKHGWLEKALTIDDVDGEATMKMEQNRIIIPHAYVGSDKIDVGAKGVITADERDGVLYVRFRKLHGILKINNDERNIDVLKAREKFDRYDAEEVLMRMRPIGASVETGGETDE